MHKGSGLTRTLEDDDWLCSLCLDHARPTGAYHTLLKALDDLGFPYLATGQESEGRPLKAPRVPFWQVASP